MANKPKGARSGAPKKSTTKTAEGYTHPDQTVLMRPEVGTQAQFKKKKPPVTYRYDSSLSPALEWDGQGHVRDRGEAAVDEVSTGARNLSQALEELRTTLGDSLPEHSEEKLKSAAALAEQGADTLRRLSRPFLNWSGKAERLSFDVPTLPLFVHERLSTKAIVETLVTHKKDKQVELWDLFGDPRHSVTDQVLRAYEHADKWVNRLILGDSLVVMNSLLHYERLGGQVQMIYIDPPYGVKFGSNFQPFVRKRDVSHGDDEDLTREPEMVKAYRDTWELGLHSYLTYMRDRLLLARELLTPSGSMFVQMSDENLHHVRELMDEVFGPENFVVTFVVRKKGNQKSDLVDPINDYLLWYAKDKTQSRARFQHLFLPRELDSETLQEFNYIELADGQITTISELNSKAEDEIDYEMNPRRLLADFPGARPFESKDLTAGGFRKNQSVLFKFKGHSYDPGIERGMCWKHTAKTDDGSPSGMDRLAAAGRIFAARDQIRFKRYADDFPFVGLSNVWSDVGGAPNRQYVVQTTPEVVKRAILMTTRPGDLVLDPTCGGGTSAYVAEQWGRRWITIDTSRVPVALTRQRLLTATFDYYALKDAEHGPSGGFIYSRRLNKKGEEKGGVVPHITSSSIANAEPPDQEILVDRPEVDRKFVRVTGPFVVEATIPTPVDWEGDGIEDSGADVVQTYGSFVERMIEVLRRSPILHLGGNKKVELGNIRPPARSLSLSAEGVVVAGGSEDPPLPVAFVFGPENGAISEKLVHEALKEASLKRYEHLYVIGFAIQPHARQLVDHAADMGLIPATYVQATPDLMMGDLLKNMRSSQIFSVCGLPEIAIRPLKARASGGSPRYEVELVGLDTFDPTTMKTDPRPGNDVPCWMLDSDYNSLCFRATQVFFPRTGAWESLKKALKSDYDETVWDHLGGTASAPFEAGEHKQVAVKVIDDRGNELLVVKPLP